MFPFAALLKADGLAISTTKNILLIEIQRPCL